MQLAPYHQVAYHVNQLLRALIEQHLQEVIHQLKTIDCAQLKQS
jgi:hypothetical protein